MTIQAINLLYNRKVEVSKANDIINWISDRLNLPCDYFIANDHGTLLLSKELIDREQVPKYNEYLYYEIESNLYSGTWTSRYDDIVDVYNQSKGRKRKDEQLSLRLF